MQAYIAWKDFLNNDALKSVLSMLTDDRTRQIKDNRRYIGVLVDVLKFTCTHRLAQRGHDESEGNCNAGNFLDLLQLIGRHDETVAQRLVVVPQNAKYTSNEIQNELIGIMAKLVQNTIAEEIRESGEFSVMADETKDCRKIEQMSIVLRYFRRGAVYESFIGFVALADLSANGLSGELLSQLETLAVDYKNKLVGQGYDGASVMSGKHRGVAALIKEKAEMAMYVHCHAHRLNLALVDSVKSVQAAAEFFVLIEKLYVFVSGSYVHARWLEIQQEMYANERPRELQRLSDTRWACRYAACRAVRDRLLAVISLLSELESGDNAQRPVEARSLLVAIDVRVCCHTGFDV